VSQKRKNKNQKKRLKFKRNQKNAKCQNNNPTAEFAITTTQRQKLENSQFCTTNIPNEPKTHTQTEETGSKSQEIQELEIEGQ
jgi:hypothetical protein